jgi:hypothetical protein
MLLNQAQHYRAIRSHDPRFDGHFFFAVNSTGIYCRPVCTAKAPKPENCLFFPNAGTVNLTLVYEADVIKKEENCKGNTHDPISCSPSTSFSRIHN